MNVLNVWYDLFPNKTIADAVMDRVIHNSHHMQFAGGVLMEIEKPKPKGVPQTCRVERKKARPTEMVLTLV